MNYRIRAATPEDVQEIIKLCGEHAAFEQASYSPAGKDEKLAALLFTTKPRLFCLLAENETGDTLGYATFALELSTWDATAFIHMDCLYLRPHARNFGIGEQFIRAISRQAKALNCSQIQWQTPLFNARVKKFYARVGAAAKEKFRFYLDQDAIEKLTE